MTSFGKHMYAPTFSAAAQICQRRHLLSVPAEMSSGTENEK